MRRRELLKTLGGSALLASVAACAPHRSGGTAYRRPYSRKPFAAPRVSMDDVIRVVVGHRPYRPAGFVVKSEKMDTRTIVHNYGHGGGGLSLGWGSSALAVRETLGMTPGDVAVIGSGIMGLTSARLLQDAGWNVTIYSRDPARHTTSNIAAGEWGPFSVHDPSVASDAFIAQLNWAARISHHAYTNLTGPEYGIRWLEWYTLSDTPFDSDFSGSDEAAKLYPYKGTLGPGEHPFPVSYVQHFVTMQIDPGVLLRRLTRDVRQAGGKFVVKNFDNVSEVLALPQPVIFNCTGLGSRQLFGDKQLTAAKGQLVFLPPDPAVDYMTLGGGRGMLHMFPRSDVLLLGGIFRPGDFSTHVEADETERIVLEHQRLFEKFGGLYLR
jgi:glycine/D-amino acid oxidase-like deaminating enzyme